MKKVMEAFPPRDLIPETEEEHELLTKRVLIEIRNRLTTHLQPIMSTDDDEISAKEEPTGDGVPTFNEGLSHKEKELTEKYAFCHKCGAEAALDALHCTMCGAELLNKAA